MKKCSYCGSEYPDATLRCAVDNELLPGGELPPLIALAETAAPTAPPQAVQVTPLTDRKMRIIEVALVCLVAFGSSILSSSYYLFFEPYSGSGANSFSSGVYHWINAILHQGISLGLLWYVLARRGKSFSDLGFGWVRMDLTWSLILNLGGNLACRLVYYSLHVSGLAVDYSSAHSRVGSALFAGGISIATILFQFLNPFFEELIARAYVMTEVKQLTGSAAKAILMSTALQTSYHFYQGAPMALSYGAMFLIFSLYYSKTGRITPVILAHLYCDVLATLWFAIHGLTSVR